MDLIFDARIAGDAGRVSVIWLVGCYVLLSVAEVLLAPLGLALVTQLAPPRRMSCAIGLWFASVAVGNGLTDAVGVRWGRWPNHRYFAVLALLSLGAAFLLWTRLRCLEVLLRRTTSPSASTSSSAQASPNSDAE